MQIQPENIRRAFQSFNWKTLFLEELGWSKPRNFQPPVVSDAAVQEVAHLGQIPVFEITTGDAIPELQSRRAIHGQISLTNANCLLLFVDKARTQTVWLWARREKNRFVYRESVYVQGQNGELFLSKLAALFVDIESSADGVPVSALQAGTILQNALDVSKITKKFYQQFKEVQLEIAPLIEGLPDAKTKARYTLVLLHRLMFIYFLQKHSFIDENIWYLEKKLDKYGDGSYAFFESFLKPLFFEGFAKSARTPELLSLIGDVPYLNGGLFLEHPLEIEYSIQVPDVVFSKILGVFAQYDWYATDDRDSSRGLLSPELLGFIFEKFINDQKSAGAYYTPEALTSYLCERTVEDLILDEVKIYAETHARRAESVFDLIGHADKALCGAIWARLSTLRVLDPAVGSGAFLVAAFYTLDAIYSQLWSRAGALNLHDLQQEMMGDDARRERVTHANHYYAMRRRIITQNLYGVDLMEGAPEIARLRLFLALVSSVDKREELEPLPNIDFNILEGNSLIGMMSCDETDFVKGGLFVKQKFDELADKKTNLIRIYKNADEAMRPQLGQLQHDANAVRDELRLICDEATVEQWNALGIKREGHKGIKIGIRHDDIADLRPFHWGAEFPDVMQFGFDAIITNPPWEIWKPNDKEFFAPYSSTITKKTMSIKEFETEKKRLLQDATIAADYKTYLAQFPHVSEYFRKSPSYANRISVVNGKKAGTDINLYKLFVERCFALLKPNGRCGIVIPSGIYTDLGAKQLREMLFSSTRITGLFGFENRKEIFEGVHRSFKFVALSFAKGQTTTQFPAAFMRHDVNELAAFPARDSLEIGVELVRQLSPDSLSVMEFKSEKDVEIAQKMLKFPLLSEKRDDVWNLKLSNEFHMTNDSHLFKTSAGKGCAPLYEGKMIWQFTHEYSKPKYWVNEKEGRRALLGRRDDNGQKLDYQSYRLGFRDIAASTNERTLVSAIIPTAFHGNKIPTVRVLDDDGKTLISGVEQLYLCAVWNSFVLDWNIRQKVTTTLNFHYLYGLPVPRLTQVDAAFMPIVTRAAKLICTTPEFDELAKAAGIGSHANGVTDATQRAVLRAELDALVARLYGLSEDDFSHILATFPLVPEPTKLAARNKFRDLERGVFVP